MDSWHRVVRGCVGRLAPVDGTTCRVERGPRSAMIGWSIQSGDFRTVPRPSLRPLAAAALSVALLAGLATPVLGWANGPDNGNGYGTHDWIIDQAVKAFGDSPPAWLDVHAALLASDDPDKVFWRHQRACVQRDGLRPRRRGPDLRRSITRRSSPTRRATTTTASTAFGWMAHYYGDILQPYHTNYAAVSLDVRRIAATSSWSTTRRHCPTSRPAG